MRESLGFPLSLSTNENINLQDPFCTNFSFLGSDDLNMHFSISTRMNTLYCLQNLMHLYMQEEVVVDT